MGFEVLLELDLSFRGPLDFIRRDLLGFLYQSMSDDH